MGESRKAKLARLRREMAQKGIRLHVQPKPLSQKPKPKRDLPPAA